ncbi:EamA family transporter RarD [Maribrevibacterium harenarium]|uniref:EamA family transporter RarD n=1 Tax=Maribrevibacterium harenarium TaxID=2589817 RepID=A0A501WT43_9GAMM|nr:EamA family transporter RarD [Maribrevibacterium harenarium]TPE51254.1 EamA family transporter RarD [Maribrevibacterium harenarium]
MDTNDQRTGYALGLSAYIIWAIAPMYFKLLSEVPAPEILAHRILWSCLIVLLLIAAMGKGAQLLRAVTNPRTLLILISSALLIAANWGTFIWAINNNQLLSASLGYYINPLVSIVLGMFFFQDKLDRPKRWAALLCLAAVAFEVYQFGSLPWVALILAFSFGFYGLLRKKVGVDSFTGMAVETTALMPFALGFLVWFGSPIGQFQTSDITDWLLLMAAGPVTMVPLMCFAAAANRVSLVTLGFFQYIGPSAMFLLAVYVYGEPLQEAKLVTFALIWCALIILIASSIGQLRKHRRQPKSRVL